MLSVEILQMLIPEILLITMAAVVFVGGTFIPSKTVWLSTTILTLVLAGLAASRQAASFDIASTQVAGPLLIDSLAATMRWVSLLLGVLFVLAMARSSEKSETNEVLGMLLLVISGLMLVSWAANLVLMFLALELISVPTYALLFLGHRGEGSVEATMKYFFLSILSSAIFLFGIALLFGVTGSLEFVGIQSFLAGPGQGGGSAASLLTLGMLMIVAGLGFKLAAVPFHFYAPDVYQATSHANAGLLAVVPKVAGVVALVRLFAAVVPAQIDLTWQLVLIMSLFSMTIGNVCALWQSNVRRMMAYSSIAHAGYMLIGLAVAASISSSESSGVYSGYAATLLYLVVYAFASLGTFAVLCELSDSATDDRIANRAFSKVSDLAGLGKSRPWMAAVLAICMFSLAGIPPLAGFWGKMTLFTGAISTARLGGDLPVSGGATWYLLLAIVGVLNAAIAATYYLRIIGVAYFGGDDALATDRAPSNAVGPAGVAALMCAAGLVIAGVFPSLAVERLGVAAQSLESPIMESDLSLVAQREH